MAITNHDDDDDDKTAVDYTSHNV